MIFTKAFNTGGRITLDILLQPTLFLSGSFSLQRWLSFSCSPVDILAFCLLLHHLPFICLPDVRDTKAVRQQQRARSASHLALPIVCSLWDKKKTCCSEGEGSRSVSFGGEQGVSLLSLLLQPVASLLLWLSKWLIQTSGPELNQKAVTSAAATGLRLQIYVSIYARFRSYRQRALMPVLVRSDELLKRLLHPCFERK